MIWRGADMLHWRVPKAQFRDYLFPLLFLKRICDVYDEERAAALAEPGADEAFANDPANHRFVVPAGCHWLDLRNTTSDVGAAILRAMSGIERANPRTLQSIFGDADWTNKELLPDGILSKLIEHFNQIDLSNRAAPGDVLGRVYEYLLKQFADLSKRKHAGEFYTPRPVVRLLANSLNPGPGETVYDPACGTGGMLLEALHHMREARGAQRGQVEGLLFGQEKELSTEAIARMNLFLHGVDDFSIARGDTINYPAFSNSDGSLRKFDCVVANPPFSMHGWGAKAWETDRWGRNLYGNPPNSNGDFAWFQHMVASMKPETGRMAIVLPDGVLFRGKAEGRIRQAVVEADLIEAVIKLGPGLFYGTGLPPCIIIARSKKAPERAKRILFLDASDIYTTQRANNIMTNEQADAIFALYDEFATVPFRARVVELDEIRSEKYDLTVARYVERERVAASMTYDQSLTELRAALDHHEKTATELDRLLRERGLV